MLNLKSVALLLGTLFVTLDLAEAGSGTVNYNSSGSSPFQTTTTGGGNNLGSFTLWDYLAGANGLTIDASHSAYTNNTEWGGTALGPATAWGTTAPSGNVANANVNLTACPTTVCPPAVGDNAAIPASSSGVNSSTVSKMFVLAPGPNWVPTLGDSSGYVYVKPQTSTTMGCPSSSLNYSAATNNATLIKNGPGSICTITVTQSTTTAMELKLYNLASQPTCSSATGLIDNIPIPSSATSPGYHLTYPMGRYLGTGISFCLTAFGAPASSTDNGNAATGVTVSFTYN